MIDRILHHTWFAVRAAVLMVTPPVYSLDRLASFSERELLRRPTAIAPRRFIANFYFDFGRFDDARRHYLALQARAPLSNGDRLRLAEACYRLARFSEAVEHFEQGVTLEPRHHTYLAIAYVYAGRFETAIDALAKLTPTGQVYEAMGFAWCSLAQPTQAIACYEHAVSFDPENSRLRENLARARVAAANAHLDRGEHVDAATLLRQASSESSDPELLRGVDRVLTALSTHPATKIVTH